MNTAPNDTGFHGTDPADPPPHQDATPPYQDLDRLRRSTSDRYIAGVAGGLGRHFDVDPTVIRVLLAVLTLFGGAGVLIYAVCWAFVPEEGRTKAAVNIGSDARKILLLAAAGVAFVLAMGDAFNGFDTGWWIASLAVVVGVIMIARDRRNDRRAATDPEGWVMADQPPTDPAAPHEAGGDTASYEHAADTPPPAWRPPVISPPLLPPHPKRTGIIWFWPTIALIAIALGIIGIHDGSHHVDAGVYPATALAITGVMLLVGSFTGRPGGLIVVGILSTMTLSAATVLGSFDLRGEDRNERPTTAAAVSDAYDGNLGRIELDLTRVVDPENLAGRTLELDLRAGEILVIVPRELNLEIHAETGFAGGIDIPGYDGGGFEDDAHKVVSGSPANDTAPLELDLEVRVGQITVEHR